MVTEREFPAWLGGEMARLANQLRLRKLEEVAAQLKRELESMGVNDTGRLEQSIRVNIVKDTVVMIAPYADYVEHGRKPGGKMPPYDKLAKWVRHKLGISGKKEVRNVTWAILTKIQRDGIKPKNVLYRAWRRALR